MRQPVFFAQAPKFSVARSCPKNAFTIFGQIYLLTGGGPGTATTSTTLLAYFQGFQNFNLSYGSTISLALLLFVTFTGLLYLSVTRLLLRRVAT